ncbi:hypothetical protein C8J57DRAFT_1497111 [Mycena rebaudengoi]|nr:hypothetical protein C8J57DRAFT_1497111 [Mycena rebaudengoi]
MATLAAHLLSYLPPLSLTLIVPIVIPNSTSGSKGSRPVPPAFFNDADQTLAETCPSQSSNESSSSIVSFGRKQHHRRRSLDCTAAYTQIKHADPAIKKGKLASKPGRRKLEYRLSLDQDCLNPVLKNTLFKNATHGFSSSEDYAGYPMDSGKPFATRPRRLSSLRWSMRTGHYSGGQGDLYLVRFVDVWPPSRATQISVSHYADFVSSSLGGLFVSRYPLLFLVILRLKPLKLARGSNAPSPSASFKTEPVRSIFRRLEDLFYRRIRNIAGF